MRQIKSQLYQGSSVQMIKDLLNTSESTALTSLEVKIDQIKQPDFLNKPKVERSQNETNMSARMENSEKSRESTSSFKPDINSFFTHNPISAANNFQSNTPRNSQL